MNAGDRSAARNAWFDLLVRSSPTYLVSCHNGKLKNRAHLYDLEATDLKRETSCQRRRRVNRRCRALVLATDFVQGVHDEGSKVRQIPVRLTEEKEGLEDWERELIRGVEGESVEVSEESLNDLGGVGKAEMARRVEGGGFAMSGSCESDVGRGRTLRLSSAVLATEQKRRIPCELLPEPRQSLLQKLSAASQHTSVVAKDPEVAEGGLSESG